LALGNQAEILDPESRFEQKLVEPVDSSNSSSGFGDGDSSHGDPDARVDFRGFADACTAIGGTSSKLEKVRLLGEYLASLDAGVVSTVTIWFTGMSFAPSEDRVLQVGWALLRDSLCAVAKVEEREFHHVYLKHSDLGETAAELFQRRQFGLRTRLSIQEVHALFESIQSARGPSSKLQLLANTLAKCSSSEAKYLVKIITGDLRIGLKEGLVEEGLAKAFGASADQVRAAHLLLGNIGTTAQFAAEQRLHDVTIDPFRAVKCMLASPEETASDIWKRLIAARPTPEDSNGTTTSSVWIEDKYDGIRCQLHKVDSRVALFSRDLKDITSMFHEVAETARHLPSDVILDGEIVAMRGKVVLPFAELQKRLGRRGQDLFLREEVPIQFVVFDLLWHNGSSLLKEPLRERRRRLDQITLPTGLRLAQVSQARTVDEIEAAFTSARARGNEGLIAKDPQSHYSPGRRGLMWLKLKKALATLDCVVVGAEYGHGKRSQVLSDYTFAVRDETTRELKTIGKAYTGLTDAEIAELTRHFLARTVERQGRFHIVQPDTVLEIAFDRIQESARHSSGLALRFPRIVRIRSDKSLEQIDTVENARRLLTVREKGGPGA
jgi:DNA ligase-1